MKWNRLNMGTRLALTIGLFLLLTLGSMSFLGNSYFKKHFAHNLLTQQQILVDALAAEVESKIQLFSAELESIGQSLPQNLLADPFRARQWLKDHHDTLLLFNNGLFLINPGGIVIASTHEVRNRPTSDLSGQPAIRDALLSGHATLSEPQTLPGEEHQSLFFVTPLGAAGSRPNGLLVGSLNLQQENFLGNIRTIKLGTKGHLHLFSAGHGSIIGPASPEMTLLLKRYLDKKKDHTSQHGLAADPTVVMRKRILTTNSVSYLLSSASLGRSGWHLLAMFPAAELFGPVAKAEKFFLSSLAFLATLATVLAWCGGQYLTRSLRLITAHIGGVLGSNELPVPVVIGNGDEVGTLSRAFNQLVDEIEQDRRAINEARDFAEQVLRDSPSPRVVVDPQGQAMQWNRAMERLTGVPAEQMLGTRDFCKTFYAEPHPILADFVLKEDLEGLKKYYPDVLPLAGVPGGLQCEGSFRNINGRDIHMIFSAAPIRNQADELIAVVESLEDVTSVRDLTTQERRYRLLMETITQAILEYLRTCDINRLAITLVNKLVLLVGAGYGILFDYEPSGDARVLAVSRTGADKKTGTCMVRRVQQDIKQQGYYRVPHNEGLLFAALSSGETLVANQPGRHYVGLEPTPEQSLLVDCFLCVPLKIGDKIVGGIGLANRPEGFEAGAVKEVEAFAQMAALAIQSTRAEEARKESEDRLHAAQKFEALGQLCGGVAHDFNNLLSIIIGYGSLLQHQMPKDTPEAQKIEAILQAGRRATDLTRQLLAFSRRQVLETRALELGFMVRDFEKLLRRLLRENIRFEFNFAEQPVHILADPGQLEQILMNLVVNARDAIGEEQGLITLSVSAEEIGESFVSTHPGALPGRYGCLSVEDSGRGMAPEVLEKIFEPFYTTKELGRGTGLGLSTVYGIVRQSGGYIDVQSTPEQGTCFTIYLPVGQKGEAVPETNTELRRVNYAPVEEGTLLVVDDEAAVLEITAQILRAQGYSVLTASSIESARSIWQLENERIGLLLTDVGLPGGSGVELAHQFMEARPKLKVVYISGHGELHKQENVARDLSGRFLQKPFSQELLLQTVQKTLTEN